MLPHSSYVEGPFPFRLNLNRSLAGVGRPREHLQIVDYISHDRHADLVQFAADPSRLSVTAISDSVEHHACGLVGLCGSSHSAGDGLQIEQGDAGPRRDVTLQLLHRLAIAADERGGDGRVRGDRRRGVDLHGTAT